MARRVSPAIAALLVAAGCSNPAETKPVDTPIPVGQFVTGAHAATDTSWYRVTFLDNVPIYAALESLSGSLILAILPQNGSTPLATIPASGGGLQEIGPIPLPATGTYRVRITGQGQFRFRVFSDGRLPEIATAVFAIDHIVTGETLTLDDVDIFTFAGQAGDEVIGYLQGTSSQASGELVMFVNGPGGELAIAGGAASADLETFTTDWRFVLPSTANYTVTIRSIEPPHTYVGAYRFQIRRIVRAPETVAPIPPAGVTITGESIDYIGDLDEFHVTGTPGDEYAVTFEATEPGPAEELALRAIGVAGGGEPLIQSSNLDSVITDRGTGRFALPAGGGVKLEIEAALRGRYRGRYALQVHKVDRRPETRAPAAVVPSDSVLNERIDAPGDIDEFTLVVTGTDTLNVMAEIEAGSRYLEASISVEVVPAGTPGPAQASGPVTAPPNVIVHSPGLIVLEPGQYVIRVWATSPMIDTFVGKYGLYVYRISRGTEGPSPVVAYGDTVSGTIDPVGDIDDYRFTGVQGDHFEFFFRSLAPAGGQVVAILEGGTLSFSALLPPPTTPLGASRTGTLTLPSSGTFRIGFAPGSGDWTARGNYQFALLRVPATPEHHAAVIAIGHSVIDEGVDSPGDIDEFTLQDTPGREFSIRVTPLTPDPAVKLEVVDPVTKAIIDQAQYAVQEFQGTIRLVMPASGSLLVRVTGGEILGLYRFDVRAVNRAPESIPAAVVVGDTISGESIAPEADIDEFTFAGTAGQQLTAFLNSPLAPTTGEGLELEVVAPSGAVVGSVTSFSLEPFGTFATGLLTLPVTGQYKVRISGNSARGGQGVYRFLLKP